MKDTVDELIQRLYDGYDYEIHEEILRRFAELEKYNTKLLNEDIRVNNELNAARKMARDLECCGNCGKHYKDCHNELSYEFCDKWQADGLMREERSKGVVAK